MLTKKFLLPILIFFNLPLVKLPVESLLCDINFSNNEV